MLFDGFTVCAQLFNFLLLVWLLRRYLYRPILDAVEAREKLIAEQLNDAAAQKAAAQATRQQFESKCEEFAEQREMMLQKAVDEVARERTQMLARARQEADELRAEFAEKLGGDRAAWEREIAEQTQQEVFAIARRTLHDLADATLEDQIVHCLARRLQQLPAEERSKLEAGLPGKHTQVVVRSVFEVGESNRNELRDAIGQMLQTPCEVQFVMVTDIGCGIEVLFNGYKVAWNISDYLEAAQESFKH